MPEVTSELMFEVLKSIQADVKQMKVRIEEQGEQLKAVRHMLIALQSDDLRHEAFMAGVRSDVDIIKRRLELSDA